MSTNNFSHITRTQQWRSARPTTRLRVGLWVPVSVLVLLAGCAHKSTLELSEHHLRPTEAVVGEPPVLASSVPLPPKPSAQVPARSERYSVVVNKTPVQDILFVIARDAKLNIDIHPGISGYVTMSALDQTLGEILDRISRQVDMRYELEGNSLTVLPDSPFLRHYKVEYPNLQRIYKMALESSTSVSSNSGSGNGSSASLKNDSSNHFWQTLVTNLKDLLRETDKVMPGGGSNSASDSGGAGGGADGGSAASSPAAAPAAAPAAPTASNGGGLGTGSVGAKSAPQPQVTFREAAAVIANPEGGVIAVRATTKQHQKVREFIDRTMVSVRRQVLIESTIVEVDLSDEYQQGINWSLLNQTGSVSIQSGPQGGVTPNGVPIGGVIPSMGLFNGIKKGVGGGLYDFQTAIRMLESFGKTRVLSSPKISALNNQPAVLRVVDNLVYFTVSGTYTPGTSGSPPAISVSSTANTASVGFTMGVTPQIGADGEVTLLLRPTISRVLSYVDDPAIAVFMSLVKSGNGSIPEVTSRVPQIQTREMESVIKVRGGMTAVLGGLMRDSGTSANDEIPGASSLGAAGDLLRYRSGRSSKSELVIFLRPVVISDASLEGDYAPWRSTLIRATEPEPQRPEPGERGKP